jgi:hypothetical protein
MDEDQVVLFASLLDKVFSRAESPLSPPFHPHSSVSDFYFARCKLGVLVSAGAATCLSTSVSIITTETGPGD